MKAIVFPLVASLLAAPAFANDLSGNKGFCSVLMCSQRRVADLDAHVARLSSKHQNNTAVRDLSTKLAGKTLAGKRGELVKFFAFTDAMDATDAEKQVERRLNDGQSDKVSNDDVRKLVAIVNGDNE